MMNRQLLFKIASGLSLIVGLFHLTGVFYPVNEAPVWRHIIFVFVNFISVYGFLKRPKWFIYAFIPLLFQQFYSHGSVFYNKWTIHSEVGYIDGALLILLPIFFANMVIELRSIEKEG